MLELDDQTWSGVLAPYNIGHMNLYGQHLLSISKEFDPTTINILNQQTNQYKILRKHPKSQNVKI